MSSPSSRINPDLFQQAFLNSAPLQKLITALGQEADQVRVIGGAVRNALRHLAIHDVDLATIHLPEEAIKRAEGVGFKTVPTGIAHGTVTVVGQEFTCEVTTLREDIETDGRHAVVRFGQDWQRDAERRDFTMNALSVDYQGRLYDLVSGLDDCLAGRVRFIGNPAQRIAEDALRILRFLRFSAHYGQGPLEPAGLVAAKADTHLMSHLSAERIGEELRKLLAAPDAQQLTYVLTAAHQAGLLPGLRLNGEDILPLGHAKQPDALLRLTLLMHKRPHDLLKLANDLRFSNREKTRLQNLVHVVQMVQSGFSGNLSNPPQSIRALAYRYGQKIVEDATYLVSCLTDSPEDYTVHIASLKNWPVPVFPLTGTDLLSLGFSQGATLGGALKTLEQIWIDSDFQATRDELLKQALTLR